MGICEHGAHLYSEFRLRPARITVPLLPVSLYFFILFLFWLEWTYYQRIFIWSGLGMCFLSATILNITNVSSYVYIIDSHCHNSSHSLIKHHHGTILVRWWHA